ncbi:phospholipase D-like domain-containing protein [Sphingomonas arantia]|uniref:Phospholipase D n=1 Tax=Sphingomonas arantia TaxID=1460676 RepID=A0ABW4TXM7_9SPHN
MLDEGKNCWRIEAADRFALVIDAERYFAVAREAMMMAQRRIMLVGWDFDARIVLDPAATDGDGPAKVGQFFHWLVERNPELEIFLLRWDVGALKTLLRGTTLFTVFKLATHPRIHVKLDAHHPTGSSHHQKLVSIDDSFAFCGGIDMTSERWDTRQHRDFEPGRTDPRGKAYKPWHDATTAISGPAAKALGEACRNRWVKAGGTPIDPVDLPGDCWPANLDPVMSDVRVGIARSQPVMDDKQPVREIEALFLDQIASAKRYVYFETQYFASRRVAEAIARRLAEEDGPEFVIVHPLTAEGWLQPIAMDSARARLVTELKARDLHDRLRLYHPQTGSGEPIYVHAKITIVDDRQLRVGSANLNNRSLRLDTECDVIVDDAENPHQKLQAVIRNIRNDLLAEHLGVSIDRVAELIGQTGSLIQAIERLRRDGHSLVPYRTPDLSQVKAWLADNEILDPEGPDDMFEPIGKRSLLEGLGKHIERTGRDVR